MTFDELQIAWQATDTHLRATQQLQQQLVHTLVQQRSRGRLAALQQKLTGQTLALCALTPLLLWGIIRWNPFGLTTWYGFAPLLLWASCFAIAALLTWQELQRVTRLRLASASLREALALVIGAQQRYLLLLGRVAWLGVMFIFLLVIARATEHRVELSSLELAGAYGTTIVLAALYSRWFWRKQWPKVSGSYSAELQTWLTELDELAWQ